MTNKRRSKSEAPQPAPVSLADFSVLFSGWDGATGDVVDSSKEAAIRACYAVCVTHAGAPGVVMVSATDAAAARQTMSLIASYFTDRPELSPMLKRTGTDTIELHGGQKILVTTAPRRPRDLLTAIRLEPAPEGKETTAEILARVSNRDIARACFAFAHDFPEQVFALERVIGCEPGFFAAAQERQRERQASWRERILPPPPAPRPVVTVPSIPLSDDHTPPGVDGVDFFSAQWEADNMLRKIFGKPDEQQHRNPKIIRRRPR